MNEKNNNDHYLSLKDIFSESLLRDLILFIFLFLLIIAQGWYDLFILLFPLIVYTFSLFFRILSSNKTKTEFNNSTIIYNPLGLERKHANRLFFCAIFQLILILWLGGESLYNAHIVQNYFSLFLSLHVFFYTFGFFWIFIDSWKYTKTEILTDPSESKQTIHFSKESKNLISYLTIKKFRMITFITFLVFICLNILNIITLLFINYGNIAIQVILPGSQYMAVSYIYFGFLTISPTLSVYFLIMNYKFINNISTDKFNKIIEPLPKNLQIKIVENLKSLNKSIKEQLKSQE